jgi:hypothetical protein
MITWRMGMVNSVHKGGVVKTYGPTHSRWEIDEFKGTLVTHPKWVRYVK